MIFTKLGVTMTNYVSFINGMPNSLFTRGIINIAKYLSKQNPGSLETYMNFKYQIQYLQVNLTLDAFLTDL